MIYISEVTTVLDSEVQWWKRPLKKWRAISERPRCWLNHGKYHGQGGNVSTM